MLNRFHYVDFVLVTAASYGNQQVHLTTTNVVKKSSYNQPMDVVAEQEQHVARCCGFGALMN